MIPSVPGFALQLAQLIFHMQLHRPTNDALSTSDPLDPICHGMAPTYVEMPKNPALRPNTSLGDIIFGAPSCMR
jgi:hypothetical protein